MSEMLIAFAPALVLLGAGYALSRWLRFDTHALGPVLTYVFIPVYVFHTLLGGIKQNHVLMLAGLGAVIALAGFWFTSSSQQLIKRSVESTAAIPNVLLFSLPVLSIAWNLKTNQRMGIVLLFLGIAAASIFFRLRGKGFAVLVRQPWLYGVAAAIAIHQDIFSGRILVDATTPVAKAAPAIALIYLGGLMHPLGGFSQNTWISLASRYVLGFVIAFVAFKFAPLPGYLKTTITVAAMGPPASNAVAGISHEGEGGNGQFISVGILITLLLYFFYPTLVDFVSKF